MENYTKKDFDAQDGLYAKLQLDKLVKKNDKETISEDDKELADIIYIFVSPDKPGIKFYSRSPRSALNFGIFETRISSISSAEWDSKVNDQDKVSLLKTREGSVAIKTYIVSVEQMNKIIDSIDRQIGNDRIIINVVEDRLELKRTTTNLDTYNAYSSTNNNQLSNMEYDSKLKKFYDEYNKSFDEPTDGIGSNNFKI